jgi:hypothetical protein
LQGLASFALRLTNRLNFCADLGHGRPCRSQPFLTTILCHGLVHPGSAAVVTAGKNSMSILPVSDDYLLQIET